MFTVVIIYAKGPEYESTVFAAGPEQAVSIAKWDANRMGWTGRIKKVTVRPAFAALLGVGFCGAVLVYGATSE